MKSAVTTLLEPCYGLGQTRHSRVWPKRNQFSTSTAFIRLPMRRLMAAAPQTIGGLFGINQSRPIAFRDRDHGLRSAQHGSALKWVDQTLLAHGIVDATGEVILHTFPTVLGYAFKPVSFWFCYRNPINDGLSANDPCDLRAVLAEVHNTFGEQHCYLLHHADGKSLQNGETIIAQKNFHVSPFFPVRGEYHFRWHVPKIYSSAVNRRDSTHLGGVKAEQSVVRIDYFDALHQTTNPDAISLSTSIGGQHCPVTWISNLQVLLSYPWQSLAVLARIHWQALKLWVKKATFHPLPTAPKTSVTQSD